MSVTDKVPRKTIELQIPDQLCREIAALKNAMYPDLTEEQFLCRLLEAGLAEAAEGEKAEQVINS